MSLAPDQILASFSAQSGGGQDDASQLRATNLALVRLLQSNLDFQTNLLMLLQSNGIEVPDNISDVLNIQ